jgi:hypothetical protein
VSETIGTDANEMVTNTFNAMELPLFRAVPPTVRRGSTSDIKISPDELKNAGLVLGLTAAA